MMQDCGMNPTNAEVTFVWRVINKFKGELNRQTFVNWGESMQGQSPKQLLYYGQYLDARGEMEKKSWNDPQSKLLKEYHFLKAIKGIDG